MEEVNLTESQYKQSNSPFTNPCLKGNRKKRLLWLCGGTLYVFYQEWFTRSALIEKELPFENPKIALVMK